MPCFRFRAEQICTDCRLAPNSPNHVAQHVNSPVAAAFRNLLARGIHPHQAARSAMIVLRIHHPDLCLYNANLVRNWLLQTARPCDFSGATY